MSDLPTGIFRTATGFRAFQWIPDPSRPNGRVLSKRFKADATLRTMEQWREDQRVQSRTDPPPQTIAPGTFADDALTYLEAVKAMPSYRDRCRDIAEWVARFGDLKRSEVTSTAIRTARDGWLTAGPRRVLQTGTGGKAEWILKPAPLAASTVNHRLRALENLYTVLDGKHAPNPVREVPEAIEPEPQPRGQSFALALEILSFMPDVTTPKKKCSPEKGSLSRVRFETMLWTGLPAVQLARLTPELVDWSAPAMRVPRRQKGKHSRRGVRRLDRPRPLLPQAVRALKRFFALKANRAFSSTSLARSVRRAIRAANAVRADKKRPPIPETTRVYDLTRHTFGSELYAATKDLKVTQDLLGHSDIGMTERYALAAVNRHATQAIRAMGRSLRSQVRAGKVSPRKAYRPVPSGKGPKRRNA